MTTLNDHHYTDGEHDVLALYINKLVDSSLRGELSNVEAMATDKALTDGDYPIQFLDPNGSDRLVTTPEAYSGSGTFLGNHPFFIVHTGSANTITVKNSDESVTLGVLSAGEVMLAVSGGTTADYAMIKTAAAYDLSVYLLKSGLSEWDEQAGNPSTPASGKWKLYFKAGGLYFIDDAGAVVGPVGTSAAYDFLSTLTAAEISITTATALTLGKMHVISGSTNFTPTLPTASGNAGKFIGARFTNTGITTIDPNGAETLDGVASRQYYQGQAAIWMSDGSNWHTIFAIQTNRVVDIFGDMFICSAAETITVNTTQQYGFYINQTTSANGETFDVPVFLAKGSWTVTILGVTGGGGGIVDWTLDGVSQTTGQDWYSASTTYNVKKTFTLTVVNTGYHVLRGTINGKNASSSAYKFFRTKLSIMPSAY